MDRIDLDELERLHKEATPGPWVANNWGRVWHTPNPNSKRLVCDTMRNTVRNPKSWRANARLIAAMREALPGLIAENRALRARVRELEAQRHWFAYQHAKACLDAASDACTWNTGDCPVCPLEKGCRCLEVTPETFIKAAEKATKEAGDETSNR